MPPQIYSRPHQPHADQETQRRCCGTAYALTRAHPSSRASPQRHQKLTLAYTDQVSAQPPMPSPTPISAQEQARNSGAGLPSLTLLQHRLGDSMTTLRNCPRPHPRQPQLKSKPTTPPKTCSRPCRPGECTMLHDCPCPHTHSRASPQRRRRPALAHASPAPTRET